MGGRFPAAFLLACALCLSSIARAQNGPAVPIHAEPLTYESDGFVQGCGVRLTGGEPAVGGASSWFDVSFSVFRRGIGITEPLARGSSGKAMLAFMAPREIDAALAGIPGATAQAGMRAELAQIRTALHAVSESEIIAGAVAIGAPVFDHAGKIAASVCVYGPETRLGGQDRRRVVKGTRRTAERISAALGFRQAEHTGAHVRAAAE